MPMMAFKVLLGIALLIFLFGDIVQSADHGGKSDHKEKKDAGKSKNSQHEETNEYRDRKLMGGGKMKKMKEGMEGKPMICYSKKKASGEKGMMKGSDGMSQRLLNQAARLLGVLTKQMEGRDQGEMMTLEEITKMVQGMLNQETTPKEEETSEEEETEETDLGLELLGIVENLLIDGGNSLPGVTVTKRNQTESEDDEMNMMGGGHIDLPIPMNDDHQGNSGTLPAIGGINLSDLRMSVPELLNVIKNPNMAFMVQSLGLGPILELLDDPEITKLLEGMDLESLMQLLRSGRLFTADGELDFPTILSIISGLENPTEAPVSPEKNGGEKHGMKEAENQKAESGNNMKEKANEMKEKEHTAKEKEHGMKGKEDTVNKEKPGKKTMKEMRKGDQKELMEALDKIMAIVGVDGEINEGNLMESMMKAIRFILTADDETLKMMLAVFDDLSSDTLKTYRTSLGNAKMSLNEIGVESDDDIEAAFLRIMSLAGVDGEITPDNLTESVMQAIQFILSADQETLKMLMNAIGDDMEKKEEKEKQKKTSTDGISDEDRKVIMETFNKIIEMAGVDGEVTEDNILESTLRAMQYILEADNETLQMMLQSIGELDLSILQKIGVDTEEEKKDGVEVVCYPMDENDMKQYLKMKGKYDEMEKKVEEDKMEKEMEEKKEKHGMTMSGGQCMSCDKQMENMKEMMKEMIHSEMGKVLSGIAINLNGTDLVDPEITTVLEKMANGGFEATLETISPEDRWDEWSEWETCSSSCGGGISARTRVCKTEYMGMDMGYDNACKASESRSCNTKGCEPEEPVEVTVGMEKWLPWSDWDPCTQTCGGGVSVRSRVCRVEFMSTMQDDLECEESESRICNDIACPVVTVTPQWLEWGEWEPCTATCGGGTTTRRRSCVRKSETTSCEQVQTSSCEEQPCFTPTQALPFWRDWGDWTLCSVTCGAGVSVRRRMCNYPEEENCMDIETRVCELSSCTTVPPTVGVWGRWSVWSTCTRTCGGGTRSRQRSCASGLCIGPLQETQPCNQQSCVRVISPRPSVIVTTRPFQPTTQPRVIAGGCPPSQYRQLRHEGSCMVFYGRESGRKSYSEYRSFCQSRGGDLVRIENVMKWVQVTYWMKGIMNGYSDKSGTPWIGLSNSGALRQWSHPGSPGTRGFAIWAKGEPKDTENSQCGTLDVETGHAIGADCGAQHYAICEFRG